MNNHKATLPLPESDTIAALLADVMPDDVPPARRLPPATAPTAPPPPPAVSPSRKSIELMRLTAGEMLASFNWGNQPHAPALPTRRSTEPKPSGESQPSSGEALPPNLALKKLTAGDVWNLFNWSNDPQAVRHPVSPQATGQSSVSIDESWYGGNPPGPRPGTEWMIAEMMNKFIWD